MDAAYLEHDVRELELTKHIALSQLDPLALEALRADGECYFEVSEASFDVDCASHYFRRVRSVAVSIACVSGPYGNVNAQLTMHASWLRDVPNASSAGWIPLAVKPTIVTSVPLEDAGLFDVDLQDARYLPFERQGAVSRWHLRLTAQALKQLDWQSIEDVVLHMRYTARDGGEERQPDLPAWAIGVQEDFAEGVAAGYARTLSLRRDLPDVLAAAKAAHETRVTFEIPPALLTVVEGRPLGSVLALPVHAPSGVAPDALALQQLAGQIATVGGVSWYIWAPDPPDTGGPVTISLEGDRVAPVRSVEDAPPADPEPGDRYLVLSGAAWGSSNHVIAEFDGTSWDFWSPSTTSTTTAVYVEAEAAVYLYGVNEGSAWTPADWDFGELDDLVLVLVYQ